MKHPGGELDVNAKKDRTFAQWGQGSRSRAIGDTRRGRSADPSSMLCADGSTEGARETAEMGWSEKYWEDVKSELEQTAIESEATSEDVAVDQPAPDQPADATGAEP
jgi:hypothetical protein